MPIVLLGQTHAVFWDKRRTISVNHLYEFTVGSRFIWVKLGKVQHLLAESLTGLKCAQRHKDEHN